jgi:hypothetical protein
MRARRIWTLAKPKDHSASLDQLQLDLAAFNRCIGALEEANASPEDVEVLAAHALTLAERIDEVRWSNPSDALRLLFQEATPPGR